ncbi:MAG: hypothetical protein ACFFDN_34320 [Candidatus Hodarchaeota archaeon]
MKNEIKDVLKEIFRHESGVICVILVDTDGIPVSFYGNFELPLEDLGAILKICYSSYSVVGIDLDQQIKNIVTEYTKIKIYQTGVGKYELIIFAKRDANFDLLHLIATRSKKILLKLLKCPEDYHHYCKLKEELKIPLTSQIEVILDKFL